MQSMSEKVKLNKEITKNTEEAYDFVRDNYNKLCFKIDKRDGRLSYLFFTDKGQMRSARKTHDLQPIIFLDDLRTVVEELDWKVFIVDYDELEKWGSQDGLD